MMGGHTTDTLKEDTMKKTTAWEPILEMDLDDGTHTCYATTAPDGRFIWLTQMPDNTWDVEMSNRSEPGTYTTICTCKTLTSAKRYAARYLL